MGQAYFLKGDYKGAAKFIEAQIQNQVKARQEAEGAAAQPRAERLPEDGRQPLPAAHVRAAGHLLPEAAVLAEPDDCHVPRRRSRAVPTTSHQLQVYRLASAVNVLNQAERLHRIRAARARCAARPGEAQAVLEKGFTNKIFTEQRDIARNQRLLDSAKKQAAAGQAALQKAEADAPGLQDGDKDVSVGVAYLGYQQYDKAAAAISSVASPSPACPNTADAQLLLGIAELGAGRKEEARKAFQAL